MNDDVKGPAAGKSRISRTFETPLTGWAWNSYGLGTGFSPIAFRSSV